MRVAQWSGTSPNMLRAALLLVDHSGKIVASYNWTEGGAHSALRRDCGKMGPDRQAAQALPTFQQLRLADSTNRTRDNGH